MMIDGMGHDLPRVVWPQMIDAIARHAASADAVNRLTAAAHALPG